MSALQNLNIGMGYKSLLAQSDDEIFGLSGVWRQLGLHGSWWLGYFRVASSKAFKEQVHSSPSKVNINKVDRHAA